MSRWLVVLAGGVGSRFWPLSTPARPKQLLPLVDDQPLLANALRRLAPLVDVSHTLILTNAMLAPTVRALVPGIPAENVIPEPRPAGTAAALAWAAQEITRRDHAQGTMISVHADWAIADDAAFRATLLHGAEIAERHHRLVTVGVVPTRPEPSFGYIKAGAEVEPGSDARHVDRFLEKPDRETAERFIAEGCLWNSGIFIWRAGDFLDEVRAHTPEVAPALAAHATDRDAFFGAVRAIAVDQGVLERSRRVVVIPGAFGWDDIGTWSALARVGHLDPYGNALHGPVHTLESAHNVVHAEGGDVVLFGVSNLVVVSRGGLTLVTTTDRATDLKTLLDSLPPSLRDRA